jgi:hypothetical protein
MITDDDVSRFWSKVSRSDADNCWPWTGCTDKDGYGQIGYWDGHSVVRAHRVAFSLANGEFPEKLCVCHRCDNPPCCNHAHLFLGTNQENTADRTLKGRSAAGARNGTIVHPELCPRGTHNGNSRLTDDKVREIRRRYSNGEGLRPLARAFGISSHNTIRLIVNRTTWKHVGE